MNIKTVEIELNLRLGKLLLPGGYKLTKIDKYTEGFVRTDDGVRQSIVIPLWDHKGEFQFSLTMCIRIEAVEAISNLFSGVLPEYQASSDTCVINLQAIVPELDRLTVWDLPTIQQAVTQLSPYISTRLLPFLDEHRDLRSVDRLLNQDIPLEQIAGMSGKGSWVLWFAMSAIILARLAQNPEFDKLVERYRNEIRIFPKDDQEKYEKLVEYLRSLP
jgi:hypothetical protein